VSRFGKKDVSRKARYLLRWPDGELIEVHKTGHTTHTMLANIIKRMKDGLWTEAGYSMPLYPVRWNEFGWPHSDRTRKPTTLGKVFANVQKQIKREKQTEECKIVPLKASVHAGSTTHQEGTR